MGLLVDGVWRDEQPGERTPDGRFLRPTTSFRNWVTEDGSAGPTGKGGFAAARDRYHLYVALLPMGASHRDHAHAPTARRSGLDVDRRTALRPARLVVRDKPGHHSGYRERCQRARRNLSARRAALYRSRERAGAVG